LRGENLKPKNGNGGSILPGQPPFHNERKTTVNSIQQHDVRGKSAADTASERDFTLSVFRTAAARQRLAVNSLETIGTALRNRLVDCEGAMRWAHEEGVIDYLVLGPTGGAK
jgi:hypothetical protein